MKRSSIRLAAAFWLAGVASLVGLWATSSRGGQEPRKPIEVPLEAIYSTSQQKGVNFANAAHSLQADGTKKYVQTYGKVLGEILLKHQSGASNIFLARGDSIAEAISAAREVLVGGSGASEPAQDAVGSKSDKYWLVVYFGAASSTPPVWIVDSAQRDGIRIRLTYAVPEIGAQADDREPYLVWVPFGKLSPGSYTLELFNKSRNEISLMRRVTVSKP